MYKAMIVSQAYSVVRLFWHYIIPVSVFAFCYGRIFQTIRRQSKVVTGHAGRTEGAATANTSGNPTSGQVQQQQETEAAAGGGRLTHTEINVLKTMTTVIAVFLVFWSVTSLTNFLQLFGVSMCVNASLVTHIGLTI